MFRKAVILWAGQFLLANSAFFYQGGFGAGHGPLDGLVLLAGFPGVIAAALFGDFFLSLRFNSLWPSLVLIPGLLNGCIYFVVCRLWQRRTSGPQD